MKVRIKFLQDVLGTASANPDIHREYIASKAPDAKSTEEEVAAIGVEEFVEKSMTIFPKENGIPFLFDYQIKGFLKEAIGATRDIPDSLASKEKSLTKYSCKRTVDNFVFVRPRKIMLQIPEGQEMGLCQRPLRAETMRGERVALATSETVPAGTTCEFTVTVLNPKIEKAVHDALEYGQWKGIGQWRNSGAGSFEYEILD